MLTQFFYLIVIDLIFFLYYNY